MLVVESLLLALTMILSLVSRHLLNTFPARSTHRQRVYLGQEMNEGEGWENYTHNYGPEKSAPYLIHQTVKSFESPLPAKLPIVNGPDAPGVRKLGESCSEIERAEIRSFAVMFKHIVDHIPVLSATKHKGEMGRLAVVGGSKEYTGAPYFSGISALHCGADLVHIICADAAAPVIKSYSPDLIVHPDLDNNLPEAQKWIDKTGAVVFGPGLGLSGNLENTKKLISHCRTSNKPIVIDADGLSIVTHEPEIVKGYKNVILTPNVVEFSRLYTALLGHNPSESDNATELLAKTLDGVTIVRKGPKDLISNGETTIFCGEEGSPRRCGGQGDLLSGTMVTFFHWFNQALIVNGNLPFPPTIGAALAACALTRRCSKLAFAKYGRSMVTVNMIPEIQFAFQQLFKK
ncbi:unnamed protein product [Calicophoron daubneyi]|uniref:ATP-dependent (S)-NAD(P)H-hydrate dehydratase n=1 Tax=Calicophoron daubneyi TaxID=300641 RepID=A0AAV2T1Y4_CALDB